MAMRLKQGFAPPQDREMGGRAVAGGVFGARVPHSDDAPGWRAFVFSSLRDIGISIRQAMRDALDPGGLRIGRCEEAAV